MEVRRLGELGWLLIGIAVLIYDELLGAAKYGYCYPYPILGCIGDVYVASAIPFCMVLAGAALLRFAHERSDGKRGKDSPNPPSRE